MISSVAVRRPSESSGWEAVRLASRQGVQVVLFPGNQWNMCCHGAGIPRLCLSTAPVSKAIELQAPVH